MKIINWIFRGIIGLIFVVGGISIFNLHARSIQCNEKGGVLIGTFSTICVKTVPLKDFVHVKVIPLD